MRTRILIVVSSAVLGAGGFAVAQNARPEIALKADTRMVATADKMAPQVFGGIELTGDVLLNLNGVVVRADRAVVNNGELAVEGNVRITLPPPSR